MIVDYENMIDCGYQTDCPDCGKMHDVYAEVSERDSNGAPTEHLADFFECDCGTYGIRPYNIWYYYDAD